MLLLIILFLDGVSPFRLLFYVPTLSYSHVAFNADLAERLVDAGHHVTMIQAVVDESVILNSTRFEVIRKYVGVTAGEAKNLLWTNPGPFEEASPLDPRILWKLLRVSNMFVKICGALMEDAIFLEEIRSRRFDIGFLEQYDSCGFGFFSAAGISQVSWLSATLLFSPQSISMGVSQPLSYHPDLAKSSSNLSSSLLINSSPFFDLSYPQSVEFKHVAGITVFQKMEKLNQFWSSVVRSPFILVSFGSIASFSSMPYLMKEAFLETFDLCPNTTFIVKWENPPRILPKNVVVADWLPQKTLIAHPNFQAMITHGGWSSILETVMASRPLVLIPLFADHWRNSRVVMEKRVGVVLDKNYITVEGLLGALKDVLDDKSYSIRAQQLSSMLRSFTPPPLLPYPNLLRSTKQPLVRPRDYTDFSVLVLVFFLLCVSY